MTFLNQPDVSSRQISGLGWIAFETVEINRGRWNGWNNRGRWNGWNQPSKKKTTQAVKATPHIIKEKKPLWYRVP